MKIAYLSQMADVSTENGITKKIHAQCVAWQNAGHAVRYFALVPSTGVWSGFTPVETELIARGGSFSRFLIAPRLARAVRIWSPDIIYFRYGHHVAGLPRLFRAIPTIAEINSDDQKEYPLNFPYIKRLYHRLTRRRILRSVSAFIPMTRELADRLAPFDRPVHVLANSIDFNSFATPPRITPPDGIAQHLVFLGSPGASWHGLDRVGELAALLPDHTIDIIGFGPADWTALHPAPPPPNLILHGHLPRDSYEPLLMQATAAIGTFGLFRKHMQEACPLKVREYLAFGLPVIAAYEDTDIPANADYYLRLPNDNAPLASHLPGILAFLRFWQNRRVPRAAIAHLDTSVKETERLAFMEETRLRFQKRRDA